MPKARIKPTKQPGVAKLPKSKQKVTFKVEVRGELNITAFVARQRVTRHVAMYIGNLLYAGEPDLLVGEGLLQWDVPVVYSLPDLGTLGTVGHILIDAQNGNLNLNESTSKDEMQSNVDRLYQQAASPARA